MTLTLPSGCKINLLLNILGRRPDGYHELETILFPVPLYDEIEFQRTGTSIQLTSNIPALPCDGSNLIVKAAERFRQGTGISDGVKIRLTKRIPMEAGLGGGSGNAATTLIALNKLHGEPLSDLQLAGLAAQLGADVPFFLQSGPALATGRGEKVESLNDFSALQGKVLLLLNPGFGISTPWAYKKLGDFPAALNGRSGRARELVAALAQPKNSDWTGLLYNSLELPAFQKYPILPIYLEEFRRWGAMAALMSGSGSSVFAWFRSIAEAEGCIEGCQTLFGSACWTALLPV